MVPASEELTRALREAEDIAASSGQSLTTAHLLLALFTFPNRAQLLLKERRIDEDTLLEHMEGLPPEPKGAYKRLKDRAFELAQGSGAEEADCLHLLVSLLRVRESLAYELLLRTGVPLTSLRNVVVSYVTNSLPRRFLQINQPKPEPVLQPRRFAVIAEPQPQKLRTETRTQTEPEEEEAPRASLAPRARAEDKTGYALDEAQFPLLCSIGRNLCVDAAEGKIDDLIGRTRELSQVIDVLGRRRSNNPCLVGPPGVGKTALVEGLALALVRGGEEVAHLADRVIIEVPVGSLVAGTSLRGALSEKIAQLAAEVKKANGRIVVFIDELHTLIGAGSSGDSAQDVSNELKAALARGEFPCIGATTDGEFKKYIEQDPAIERRFTAVEIKEPSVDEAVLMLEGGIAPYADHHGVTYSVDALQAACTWSHRFIAERKLPDKAFSVVDIAGSRARRHGRALVERRDIAEIIAELAGVPIERFAEGETDRLARAEQELRKHFVGQERAVERVAAALRRGFAGFGRKRPVASFLFLGPTGVGKTELAKVLAEFLFGRKDALVRVDLSEFVEAHSLAKLIGSPPGYVGFGEGGQLTEAVRKRPFQVILFDEFEKAHPDVRNVLLQILDDGRLTDGKGRTVRFVDTVMIMTSNAGAHSTRRNIGFEAQDTPDADAAMLAEAKGHFPPELWNRIDDKIVFHPLGQHELQRVARLMLEELSLAAFAEREVSLTFSLAALEYLASIAYDPEMGARPLRQTIQRLVEAKLADWVLRGALRAGECAHLCLGTDGELTLEKQAASHAKTA